MMTPATAQLAWWSLVTLTCLVILVPAIWSGLREVRRVEGRDRAIKSLTARIEALEQRTGQNDVRDRALSR